MKIDIYKKDIFTRIFLYLFLSITFPVFLSAQYVYTPSEVFSVKVNDEPVFVEYYKTVPDEYGSTLRWPLENVSICHILFTGAMTIEITCNKSFQNYNISPKRHDINHYRDGNKVIVTINKPCKFNINMDNDNNVNEQVFFFVDLLENTPDLQDSNVKNIMNYPGADNTGTVDITNVIQSAINGLSSGQTLFFPKGQYLSKYLKLKSNMTLYLEKDAILLGTKNSNDYYWASGQDGGFLLIKDCNNTKIAGYGRINLRGEEMQEIAGKNLHIRTVFIQGISTNIVLQDFFALDPPRANIQISSNNVTLRNVKALSTQAGSNTDGIDPMNGKDLLFDNCFIYGRDDAIAIKSYFRPSSIYPPFTPANIFVANSLFSSLEATMKVGTETERTDTIKNIIFENCDALYAGHAMSLWTKDFSSIKDVYFRNIGVDRIKPSPYVQQGSIFHFNVIPRDDTKNPGLISNVWAERIFSESLGVRKSDVVGQPVNKKIDKFTFNDFYVNDILVTNSNQSSYFTKTGIVGEFSFGTSNHALIGIEANQLSLARGESTDFRITRTGNTERQITVSYVILGNARMGIDYDEIPTFVTFLPGETEKTVTIRNISLVNGATRQVALSLQIDSERSYMLTPDFIAAINIERENQPSEVINELENVFVFPNPTKGNIELNLANGATYKLRVMDSAGKLLAQREVTDLNNRVDMSAYPTGVYVLLLNDGRNEGLIQFVKQ